MEDTIKIPKSLSEHVYKLLREEIINQEIKGGEKLTLKLLQQKYGVSMTPIREAISLLSKEGLVTQLTNVGARVIDLGEEDIEEIYDCAYHFDNAALQLAMERQPQELEQALTVNIQKQKDALANDDIKNFMDSSDAFHNIFHSYSKNNRLYEAACTIRGQLSILATKYQNVARTRRTVLEEHCSVYEAVMKGDARLAQEALKQHVEHTKAYLLGHLQDTE